MTAFFFFNELYKFGLGYHHIWTTKYRYTHMSFQIQLTFEMSQIQARTLLVLHFRYKSREIVFDSLAIVSSGDSEFLVLPRLL